MTYEELYLLLRTLLVVLIGFLIGWASNPFNKAKVWRLLGRQKKVVFVTSANGNTRDFLVDNPVGEEPILVRIKPFMRPVLQEFTLIPNPAFDGMWKTISYGVFDARDGRQIPLSQYAHFLGVEEVKNDKGEVVGNRQVWESNGKLLGSLVSPAKLQNILSSVASSARLKARNETSQDKKQSFLVIVAATCGIVTLLLVIYLVFQLNSNLNITGGISNYLATVQQNATVYKAT